MKRVRNAMEFAKARERLGMTKVDVATLLRLPKPQTSGYRTVSRWEAQQQRVPGSAMTAMEAFLSGWRPSWWKKDDDATAA
ncbi:hypothetical protein [Sphingobium yanoikuyae]|uniref:hypothetical protein n=1 Tax=Sphingobium yanoikuyae TaxID=13690 RepID=UPI0035C70546